MLKEQTRSEHIKEVKRFLKVGFQVLGISIAVNVLMYPLSGVQPLAQVVMSILIIFALGGLIGTKVFKWK